MPTYFLITSCEQTFLDHGCYVRLKQEYSHVQGNLLIFFIGGIRLIIHVSEHSYSTQACMHTRTFMHAMVKVFFFCQYWWRLQDRRLFLLFVTKMCVFKSKTVEKKGHEVKVLTNLLEKLLCHSVTVQTVLNFVSWPKIDQPFCNRAGPTTEEWKA